MLTIIRNGVMAKLEKVDMPSSKMRESLAKKLEQTGYIRSFKVAKDSKQGIIPTIHIAKPIVTTTSPITIISPL